MPTLKLTKRAIDALLAPQKATIYWDADLKGFGLKVTPADIRAFLVDYRSDAGVRSRIVIGRLGVLTPEQARARAREVLADVAKGGDPGRKRREAKEQITVAEICDLYMTEARAGRLVTRFKRPKSSSTVEIDEGRVSRHIVPLIGGKATALLTRGDIQRMHDAISAGKTAAVIKTKARGKAIVRGGAGNARRIVGFLGGVLTWAIDRELIPGPNPVTRIRMRSDATKDRTLTADELARLGEVLRASEARHPQAVAVIRLIALTGLRFGEGVRLEWSEIDADGSALRLSKSKTGASRRPIGKPALDHLRGLLALHERFVFPNSARSGPAELRHLVAELFDAAGLHDARAHDLRRTFASIAADVLGYADSTVAELLGHAQRGVTARHYIRRIDASLIAAATATASIVANALEGRKADVVALNAGTRS